MSVERIERAARAARRALALAAMAAVTVLPAAVAGAGPGNRSRAPRAAAASSFGPTVQAMIVGAGNVILSPARMISASATTVQVGGRSCSLAAGTPLAVLADLHRTRGPAFALRDYGRCGSSPRSSGELFVYSLDGETNHGQNGWEYKVGNRSGTTGAGDSSGAQGDGRLLGPGQRVLWFWCQSLAGGCQRTLDVSASPTVSRGGRLAVRVMGYDNEGRGIPMSGAVVALGRSSARTGVSGRAALIAPSTGGPYRLTAARPGSVPAFPETVLVR